MLASNRATVVLPAMFAVALVLGVAAPVFSAEAPQKVRIAYASRSSSAMPQYMALQRGYFKAEGLDVEIIQMNPRLGATAVVNGDVSFATPFTSTFRGVLQGFPMKLVFIHLKKGPYYVMVRPDIKDVQRSTVRKRGLLDERDADSRTDRDEREFFVQVKVGREKPQLTGRQGDRMAEFRRETGHQASHS